MLKEVIKFLKWAATKRKGYARISERTSADGDDNGIASSANKLDL